MGEEEAEHVRDQRQDAFTHSLDAENTTHAAAIDVGANYTLALVISTGDTAVYHARPAFDRFCAHSDRIAVLQSQLPDDRYTSTRMQRLYVERGRKRDHRRDAAVKHAAEWLVEQHVETEYVGALIEVRFTTLPLTT